MNAQEFEAAFSIIRKIDTECDWRIWRNDKEAELAYDELKSIVREYQIDKCMDRLNNSIIDLKKVEKMYLKYKGIKYAENEIKTGLNYSEKVLRGVYFE